MIISSSGGDGSPLMAIVRKSCVNKLNNTVTGLQYYIVGSVCLAWHMSSSQKRGVGPPSCVEK